MIINYKRKSISGFIDEIKNTYNDLEALQHPDPAPLGPHMMNLIHAVANQLHEQQEAIFPFGSLKEDRDKCKHDFRPLYFWDWEGQGRERRKKICNICGHEEHES